MVYRRSEPFNWEKIFTNLEKIFALKEYFLDKANGIVSRQVAYMGYEELFEYQMKIDLEVESGEDDSPMRVKQSREKSFLPENYYKNTPFDLRIFKWNDYVNSDVDEMSFGYMNCFPHQFRIRKKFTDENGVVKEYRKNKEGERIIEFRFPKLNILPVIPMMYRDKQTNEIYKEIMDSNFNLLAYDRMGATRKDGLSPFSQHSPIHPTDEDVKNFNYSVYGLCENNYFDRFLNDFEASIT